MATTIDPQLRDRLAQAAQGGCAIIHAGYAAGSIEGAALHAADRQVRAIATALHDDRTDLTLPAAEAGARLALALASSADRAPPRTVGLELLVFSVLVHVLAAIAEHRVGDTQRSLDAARNAELAYDLAVIEDAARRIEAA